MKVKKTPIILAVLICLCTVSIVVAYPKIKTEDEFKNLKEIFKNDKSIESAIDNGFAQHINKETTDKNITFSVDDIIMDSRKLIIAFSIKSKEKYKELYPYSLKIMDGDNKNELLQIHRFGFEDLTSEIVSRGFYEIVYDYRKDMLPENIIIKCEELEGSLDESKIKKIKGNWNVQFSIDRENSEKDKPFEYHLFKKVKLQDEVFTIDYLEVYPTVMNLKISMEKNNSHNFIGLKHIIIEDEKGNEYKAVSTVENGKESKIVRFESPYFEKPELFKVKCEGLYLMPKKDEYIVVDLEKKKVIEDCGYNLKFNEEKYNVNSFYNDKEKCDYVFYLKVEEPWIEDDRNSPYLGLKEHTEDKEAVVSDIIPINIAHTGNIREYNYIIEIKDKRNKPNQLKFKVEKAYKYVTEPFEVELEPHNNKKKSKKHKLKP